mgnify:CR=1 FL=1
MCRDHDPHGESRGAPHVDLAPRPIEFVLHEWRFVAPDYVNNDQMWLRVEDVLAGEPQAAIASVVNGLARQQQELVAAKWLQAEVCAQAGHGCAHNPTKTLETTKGWRVDQDGPWCIWDAQYEEAATRTETRTQLIRIRVDSWYGGLEDFPG